MSARETEHEHNRPATPLETDSGPSSLGDDADSAISDIKSTGRTESLASSAYAYQFKDGRRYHGYDAGVYMLPNDEAEQDRLDLQHHVFRISVDGKLFLAPIPKDVQSVLDVGCGTGIWTIEFADDYPNASVLGVDLSPIQPAYVPVNCSFRVDNVETDWVHEETYDFIHSRAMVAALKDWPGFIQQAFDHLNPGGYLEMQDVSFPTGCNNPEDEAISRVRDYGDVMLEAGKRIGLDFEAPEKWREWLEAAGFVDIHMKWVNWPIGPWAKHQKNKILGRFTYLDFYDAIEAAGPLVIAALGKTQEEVQTLIDDSRAEFKAQKIRLYQRVCFCYARKPENTQEEEVPSVIDVEAENKQIADLEAAKATT
ncbi:S-adenosyl-L-methionine-dependent methyltransferase [Microthyrium microscopicum]|uniref:S-adenosyl-L-methionine-dependent methyltransferase n=1 Tax=Microthyrium microscopicum TaxID=703497 RepID=A0A6A6ULQ5_9PEZI|nr:S-adenosyl-L-methionine-dependent methyltransferase [Microthyrium microscopicum]